jgi:hypothetical protein
MHLNIKPYLFVMASVVLIIIFYGCVRNFVFKEAITGWEITNPSLHKGILMGLFLLFGAALVPIALKGYLVMQLKAGNGELSMVKLLRQHSMESVYAVWVVFILGFSISLPVMIKQGFFSNMQ